MNGGILIADDSLFMREALKEILFNHGYDVVGEASTGVEAIEMFMKLRPDLVTMDVTMPDMSGLGGLQGIKQIDPNAKVIMCSAMGQDKIVMEAFQNGACGFILKPFTADKVLETLKKCGF